MDNQTVNPVNKLVNPYIAGAPVVEARMFFGREDVFDWIQNSLTGRYADHILVIHGQRRVGKTSVLKQLGNRLPEKYIPIFFDLQGRTHTTLDRFLWWLAREIVRVLKQERDITVPVPEKEPFAADPEYFENHFLPGLRPVLGEHSLLLTFDEFDNLEESEIKEELARPLIDYLRRMMGQEGLNFIFSIGSSGRKLENMQAAYTEFFKTALYKKISFLSREQTASLVTKPVEGLLEYDREAVERIYYITSGHPYFTQLICHEVFSLCQRTGILQIREADVESVLDDVVERGTVNLKFVWDEASDTEKWGLAALAQLDKTETHAVADYLRTQRVRFSEADLTSGLLHMREKDVLTTENRFVIQLLRLWLRKNRPLDQVREELTEVNPIANRYNEIGLEFLDAGQYDKAIENFREALAVAPEHIQAQVNIAQTYVAQKSLAQAVVEFEKALTFDDEDVTARSGLCGAYLALGDAAREKGRTREAIQSYQKVLDINAEHTEARGRMAEIQRQRAEKALADGRDEEALAAFSEALKFTPEDEALAKRYEQAKVEKRTKVLVSLLAKAEKEQSARNWDAALSILNQADEIDPGNENVQKRLATIKEEQHKAQLAALLARADRVQQAGRWGLVTAALEDYLKAEPADLKVLERLENARQKQTEIQADEMQTRARSLTRQEHFEEALAAWQELLKISPGQAQGVQAEIEKVQQAQGLAKSYAEGQAAFTKKNYDKAVALLKSVIDRDVNYKDASRLFAQAVELRRTARKWWQSRWLWAGIGVVVLVALGWMVVPLLKTILAAQPAQPSPQPTQAMRTPLNTQTQATPMSTWTAIPTAIPVSWMRLSALQFVARDDVTDIAVDPNDPGVIYVSTADAGIYKSIDGGLSWQPILNGLASGRIDSMAMDPNNSATLYAAASDSSVFKTTDSGQSWQLVHHPIIGSSWFPQIAIAPWNSQVVFHSQELFLYRSDDGGQTWQQMNKNECPAVAAFALHPSQPETLFAASFAYDPAQAEKCPGGIYKSSDAGKTWEIIGLQGYFELGKGMGRAFAIGGENGEFMYISGRAPGSDIYQVFGSQDRGETWKLILLDQLCDDIRVNSADGTQVYCHRFGSSTILSLDAGSTWTPWNSSIPSSQNFALYMKDKLIIVGGAGLYTSADAGQTWENRSSGLGTIHLELKMDPSNGFPLFLQEGVCQPGSSRLLYTSQDGKNWNLISDKGCGLAFDANKQTLYRRNVRSSDGGGTWQAYDDNYMVQGIITSPLVSGMLLKWDGSTIWKSTDYGSTWNAVLENAYASASYAGLFIAPQEDRLYANASYHSEDGGESWTPCGTQMATSVSEQVIAIDPRDSKHLYAATPGQGVMVSHSGCQTWESSNNGLGSLFVNAIVIDPNNPDTIYAGTDGGAYVSFDGGQNWNEINDGLLGATVVYSIVVDKDSNVYAATPYGIFKLVSR